MPHVARFSVYLKNLALPRRMSGSVNSLLIFRISRAVRAMNQSGIWTTKNCWLLLESILRTSNGDTHRSPECCLSGQLSHRHRCVHRRENVADDAVVSNGVERADDGWLLERI